MENYLNLLIAKMRHELRAQLGKAIDDYATTGEAGKNRPEWLKNHIAQLALVTTQQQWSLMTEKALRTLGSGGDPSALKSYYEFQLEMLADMIKMVQVSVPPTLSHPTRTSAAVTPTVVRSHPHSSPSFVDLLLHHLLSLSPALTPHPHQKTFKQPFQ